jgi:PhnB protein
MAVERNRTVISISKGDAMQIQPYLFFEGRCEEAAEFYGKAIGAEVKMLMRYKDSPEQPQKSDSCAPISPEKVMHMRLQIGQAVILASDGHCSGKPNFQGFTLSLTVANEAEAGRMFNALAAGGKVQMPLTKTFFSPSFGMVADKFGLSWMIYVAPAGQG